MIAMKLEDLKAPFDPSRVSWRVGSTSGDKSRGLALAYLDARDVMERLDEVCGAGNWQNTYPHAGTKTVCSIGIKVGDEWVWKSNGAGDSDIEAEKGALSDAFKRAAVLWGVGRYLYDLEAPWVAIEPMGRSYKIKDSEMPRLAAILAGKKVLKVEQRKVDAKVDAKEWVSHTEQMLVGFNSIAELTAWETKATPAIVRLQTVDADLHARLVEKIKEAYERLGNT